MGFKEALQKLTTYSFNDKTGIYQDSLLLVTRMPGLNGITLHEYLIF